MIHFHFHRFASESLFLLVLCSPNIWFPAKCQNSTNYLSIKRNEVICLIKYTLQNYKIWKSRRTGSKKEDKRHWKSRFPSKMFSKSKDNRRRRCLKIFWRNWSGRNDRSSLKTSSNFLTAKRMRSLNQKVSRTIKQFTSSTMLYWEAQNPCPSYPKTIRRCSRIWFYSKTRWPSCLWITQNSSRRD